jgi:predicted hotdog family 3-hydroxylacyl-ACP dehydratase
MIPNPGFPISAETLQPSLPHRPPMVWIDRVTSAGETGGTAEARFDLSGPQCDSHGLRQTSLIEMMAQAMGYIHAAHQPSVSQQAFLAALKNIEYCSPEAWRTYQSALAEEENALFISVSVVRVLGPVTLVAAQVAAPDGTVLARGELKLFNA